MRTRQASRAVIALAAAGVLTALLFGSVTAAQATYLQSQGFSFKGLVSQLRYEGYSRSDARYGASHAGANWFKQAVRVARDYLRSEAFSQKGLIEQLEYEGFTPAQARYAARRVGL